MRPLRFWERVLAFVLAVGAFGLLVSIAGLIVKYIPWVFLL